MSDQATSKIGKKGGSNSRSLKVTNSFSALSEEEDTSETEKSTTETVVLTSVDSLRNKVQDLADIVRALQTDVETLKNLVKENNKNNNVDLSEKFYNFKKDVKDFLGLDSPSNINGSGLPSSETDIQLSFRAVLEKISNPLDPPPNHDFHTFLSHYSKWKTYRSRGGFLSLFGYIQNSPSVYDVYLRKARSHDHSFYFHNVTDSDNFFNQLIDHVFFPNGFDLQAFEVLVKTKKMLHFSIQQAAQFAFDINSLLTLLPIQLQPLHTPDLWKVVTKFVSPKSFQSFLYSKCPRTREQFLSAIDNCARIFDQQSALSTTSEDSHMHRRSSIDSRSPSQDFRPPLKVNSVGKREHTCSKCYKSGHLTEDCSLAFCPNCHAQAKEFMHSPQHCFANVDYPLSDNESVDEPN